MGDGSILQETMVITVREDTVPSSVAGRRQDIVRRLIDRGLSPTTLSVLLPEFADAIARVSAAR